MNYLCSPEPFMKWEPSSVGSERLPYKQRVGGSNPSAPTLKIKRLQRFVTSFSLSILKFTPKFTPSLYTRDALIDKTRIFVVTSTI